MNGNGQVYVRSLNSDTCYDFIDGANTKNQLLRSMPDVWDSTKAKWDESEPVETKKLSVKLLGGGSGKQYTCL